MNEFKKELQTLSDEDSKMVAIVGFIMSILSVLQCSSQITSMLYAVASIIMCACALYIRKNDAFAKAGIVISIVSIILSVILLIVGIMSLFALIGGIIQEI